MLPDLSDEENFEQEMCRQQIRQIEKLERSLKGEKIEGRVFEIKYVKGNMDYQRGRKKKNPVIDARYESRNNEEK